MLRDTSSSTHLAQAPPGEVFAAIAAALDARVIGQFAGFFTAIERIDDLLRFAVDRFE